MCVFIYIYIYSVCTYNNVYIYIYIYSIYTFFFFTCVYVCKIFFVSKHIYCMFIYLLCVDILLCCMYFLKFIVCKNSSIISVTWTMPLALPLALTLVLINWSHPSAKTHSQENKRCKTVIRNSPVSKHPYYCYWQKFRICEFFSMFEQEGEYQCISRWQDSQLVN